MLVALGDTHGETAPELTRHLRERLDRAEVVVHAGDFTTEGVLEGFESFGSLVAVHGNADERAVRERLPASEVYSWEDRRLAVTHGHDQNPTSLSLLSRQERADVVVVGHTHRSTVTEYGDTVVVNPGSHADPRGGRATYAVLERRGARLRAQVRTVEGTSLETVDL